MEEHKGGSEEQPHQPDRPDQTVQQEQPIKLSPDGGGGLQLKYASWAAVFVAIVLIASAVVYFLYLAPQDELPARVAFSDLRGSLYLAIADASTNQAQMHRYDIGGDRLVAITNEEFVSFFPTPISDQELVFAAAPFEPNDLYPLPYTEFLKLYRRNLETGEQTVVSDSELALRRRPVWSESADMLAFYALSSEALANEKPLYDSFNDWELYISDLEGNETLIGNGVSPSWSRDGKRLYYLGEDGLYRLDLAHSEILRVLEFPPEYLSTPMTVVVDPDEQFMVWTDDINQTLYVYDVRRTRPFTTTLHEQIQLDGNQRPYWGAFSPDGKYFTYVTIDRRGEDTASTAVWVVDIEAMEHKELLSLGDINAVTPVAPIWHNE